MDLAQIMGLLSDLELSQAELIYLGLSAVGGAVIGPVFAQFLGGARSGVILRVIAGILGGAGLGAGADIFGAPILLGSEEMMVMAQTVLGGAIGGVVLSTLTGSVFKRAED